MRLDIGARVVRRAAGPVLLLFIAAAPLLPARAASPPADAVVVTIEGVLDAAGALRGTLRAAWSGRPAADLRRRLEGLAAAERDARLASMLPPALTAAPREVKDEGGRLEIVHPIDSPRFARRAGAALEVTLPVYRPYDFASGAAPPLPLAVLQDFRLGLPAGMAPASLPSVISTITPEAGRYVLYYDVEGPPPGRVTARRELEITARGRLAELLVAAGDHDAAAITLVPVPSRPRSSP